MQRAMNLEVEKDETITDRLPCESLSEDFVGFNDIKLSSTHPRGEVLFEEGQAPRGVYVLCSGRAKVSITSSEGKTVILRLAKPGDLLGVNSVLKGLPYDSTVETLERSRIDFVQRADFLKLIDKSKAARVGVTKTLGNELSDVVEHARLLLLSQNAQEKLVRLLLNWCDELGEPTPEGIRLNHGLTNEEIAQMICGSRETVSRLFTQLKEKQVVRLNPSGVLLCYRAALKSVLR